MNASAASQKWSCFCPLVLLLLPPYVIISACTQQNTLTRPVFLHDPPQFQPLRCGGWIYCLFRSHIQPPKYKAQIKRWRKGQKLREQSAVQHIYNRLASALTCKCCETSHFMAAARNYSLNYWHLRWASGHQETPETEGEGVGCAVKAAWLNRLLR